MAELIPMSKFLAQPTINKYIKDSLGNKSGAFITSLTQLASSSPQLKNCDRNSLLSCALKSTSLGLPFDTTLGKAYAVPYKNKSGIYEAQFQLGYKGIIDLAIRSGMYEQINVMDVRKGEFAGRDEFGDPIIKWLDEDERENAEVIGYTAAFKMRDGYKKRIYWTIKKVKEHAMKYSQGYRYYAENGSSKSTAKSGNKESPWVSDFDGMACKTVLKSLITKWGTMSIEYQTLINMDQAVIKTDFDNNTQTTEYVDNQKNTAKPLSGEQQTKLLEKHGGEKITKALKIMELNSLNEVDSDSIGTLEKILETVTVD